MNKLKILRFLIIHLTKKYKSSKKHLNKKSKFILIKFHHFKNNCQIKLINVILCLRECKLVRKIHFFLINKKKNNIFKIRISYNEKSNH